MVGLDVVFVNNSQFEGVFENIFKKNFNLFCANKKKQNGLSPKKCINQNETKPYFSLHNENQYVISNKYLGSEKWPQPSLYSNKQLAHGNIDFECIRKFRKKPGSVLISHSRLFRRRFKFCL